jgi:hypothetical protein
VYNEAIADYSGEAYFFFWARQHIPMPARVLASTIKDSSLLSGLASNLLTLAAAALVLGTNSLHTLALAPQQTIALQLGLLLCFGLSVGLLLFGRRVFGLALGQALQVFGLHLIRHGATLLVQLLQWVAILPHVSFDVWALFLAARLLVGRLPLANKELLFSALALSMLGLTNSAPAVLAAALVANGALMLVAHALLFVVLHARSLHASLNPFRF